MKYLLYPAFVASLLLSSMSAQTTETFDSPGGDANWVRHEGSTRGSGALTFANDRLEYTASASTAPAEGASNDTPINSAEAAPSTGGNYENATPTTQYLVGYLNSNWSAQVDVHIKDFENSGVTPLNGGEGAGSGRLSATAQGFMAQLNVNSLANSLYDRGMYIQVGYHPIYGGSVQASSGGWGPGGAYQGAEIGANLNFTLRASFDASTHTLLGSVSYNGGETWEEGTLTTVDVTAPDLWNVSSGFAGPAFGITLTAYSNNLDVVSGDIYFDNFVSDGLSNGEWPAYGSASAIPEPSTYAALAGAAVLGLASWRKRRAAKLAPIAN